VYDCIDKKCKWSEVVPEDKLKGMPEEKKEEKAE
jgi:hypothetical protein